MARAAQRPAMAILKSTKYLPFEIGSEPCDFRRWRRRFVSIGGFGRAWASLQPRKRRPDRRTPKYLGGGDGARGFRFDAAPAYWAAAYGFFYGAEEDYVHELAIVEAL